METGFEALCQEFGIRYRSAEDDVGVHLDFYLPDHDTHVELKQFHSPRIAAQTGRVENVIVVQGRGALVALRKMMETARG